MHQTHAMTAAEPNFDRNRPEMLHVPGAAELLL